MMIKNIWIYPLMSICLLIVLSISCRKDDNSNNNNIINNNDSSIIVFNPNLSYGTVNDIDGNVYKTISIGTQTWMAENLKVVRYRNGDSIPNVYDSAWCELTLGAYCEFENNSSYGKIYGKLYNWFAVNDNRNISPIGWHVATTEEWTILIDFLGGQYVAAGKLKETGTNHWEQPNLANNESGFTALPGAWRDSTFNWIGGYGMFWTSTEYDTNSAWNRYMYNSPRVISTWYEKCRGLSVRCVKDS